MKTGAKIAIGCGALVLLGIAAGVVAILAGAYWVKGKTDAMQADFKKSEELRQKADAIPFTEPEGGILKEDRLVTFLEVRKRLFPLYEKHRAQLEQLQKSKTKEQPDFSDVSHVIEAMGFVNELRQAHLQALVDIGMSSTEYRYYVEAVYKTMWQSELRKQTGGRTLTEYTEESLQQAARALEQQAQATPDPSLPPEVQQAMRDAQGQARKQQAELQRQAETAGGEMESLEVPEENVALYKKYEADIKKYAMTGLEWLAM